MKWDLSWAFGMTEMEMAANKIINKAVAAGTWIVPMTYEEAGLWGSSSGFLHLIHNGYMRNVRAYKAEFYPNQEFVNQVMKAVRLTKEQKTVLAGLKGPGDIDEFVNVVAEQRMGRFVNSCREQQSLGETK